MENYDQSESMPLMCEMDASERPREKAMEHGLDALTDAELMAIIFATGVRGKSVVTLCNDILDDNCNHLSRVAKMTVNEMVAKYKGIGKVKAITLLAALKLGERAATDSRIMAKANPLATPESAYQHIRHRFQWLQHEEFWVMYINRAGHPIKEMCISKGGTAATTVDVKIIMRTALECLASSMILFHNHPSGTLRPSIEDERLTDKIVTAAKYFDIRVVDHIIVTDGAFYSFQEHGKL